MQRTDELLGFGQVGDSRGLGDFEPQRRDRQAGGGDLFLNEFEYVVVGERLSREIHREDGSGVAENLRVFLQARDRLGDYPTVDLRHQLVALGSREERRRWHCAAVVVFHAQQDFVARLTTVAR